MQLCASRCVNAFQNSGVHCDSDSPWVQFHRFELAHLLRRDAHEVALAPGLGDRALREGQHEHVLGEDALLLHARGREVDEGAGVSCGALGPRTGEGRSCMKGGVRSDEEASPLAHADATAGARDPSKLVELAAKLGDEVSGLCEQGEWEWGERVCRRVWAGKGRGASGSECGGRMREAGGVEGIGSGENRRRAERGVEQR